MPSSPALPKTIEYVTSCARGIWEHDQQRATHKSRTSQPAGLVPFVLNETSPIPTVTAARVLATICTQVNANLIVAAGDDGLAPEYLLRPHMEAPAAGDLGTVVVQGPIGAVLRLRVLPPANAAELANGFAPVTVESETHGTRVVRDSTTDPLHVQAELRLHAERVRRAVCG